MRSRGASEKNSGITGLTGSGSRYTSLRTLGSRSRRRAGKNSKRQRRRAHLYSRTLTKSEQTERTRQIQHNQLGDPKQDPEKGWVRTLRPKNIGAKKRGRIDIKGWNGILVLNGIPRQELLRVRMCLRLGTRSKSNLIYTEG
jgi:hypothetical protein